jgi:hypothetical protein
MFFRYLVVCITCVALVGCAPMPPLPKPKQTFNVRLEVLTDSLGNEHLVVVEPPQCTLNPTEKGCITVPSGKVGVITFKLKDAKGPNCQGAAPVNWRLDGIQLSMKAKDTSGTVTVAVQNDFGTDAQGNVLNPEFPGGPNMKFEDQNDKAYKVWYTVSAVSCANGDVITTDPWIENKG